jgi:DNA-3-methyladenine glycosylase I
MAGPPEQIQPSSLNDYLEVQSKAVFQSGISWKVVENKWPGTKEAFAGFDVQKVANFDERDLENLAQDTRVIRHARKLAAVVYNAQQMLRLDEAYDGFPNYLRAHGSFDGTLKAMKKDFKYMGPSGVYFFLYVVGEEVPPHDQFEATYRKK